MRRVRRVLIRMLLLAILHHAWQVRPVRRQVYRVRERQVQRHQAIRVVRYRFRMFQAHQCQRTLAQAVRGTRAQLVPRFHHHKRHRSRRWAPHS